MTLLRKEDIHVDIERSGVYPNQTCHVRLTHIPTGLIYECGHHRSEIRNKAVALVGLGALVQKSGWVPPNDGGALDPGCTERHWTEDKYGNETRIDCGNGCEY